MAISNFPRFSYSKSSIELTPQDTDVTLLDLDFIGHLSAISLNFDNANVEVVVEVDSVEIFRAVLSDINNGTVYDLDAGNPPRFNFPVATTRSSKHILFNFLDNPAGVSANLTIKAQKKVSATVNMLSRMITYKEV